MVAEPPDASVAPSIMLAFTQFNKGVCLSQDDLDALNTLYPLCDHRVATPQCYKTESYIGVVRFAVLVGIPVILFLVLILICHWGIDVWEDKQHDRLQDKLATRPNLSPDPSPNPNPNPSPSPNPNQARWWCVHDDPATRCAFEWSPPPPPGPGPAACSGGGPSAER